MSELSLSSSRLFVPCLRQPEKATDIVLQRPITTFFAISKECCPYQVQKGEGGRCSVRVQGERALTASVVRWAAGRDFISQKAFMNKF